MGVDILRARFMVRDDDLYNPMEIVSERNVFEYFGDAMRQARDYFSVTKHCSITDGKEFVDREMAVKCINEHFDRLKDKKGEISDVYRGFPKTNKGFVSGFFKKQIMKADFDHYATSPYLFEKYKYRRLTHI
jgi:hypothetical protein